nr:molybdopterin cofactor-binding domain-containing protein [Kitasatospora sp. MMS16-BH015]
MNPLQCRGQVEGGVAQALGATLFERVLLDEGGQVTAAAFRRYRLAAFAKALRDATGVRFTEAPFLRDKVWQALAGRNGL